jgi:hypothetical protein
MRGFLKARYGAKTQLKLISPSRGLFGRGLGFLGTSADAAAIASAAAGGLIDVTEERALWSRYGL